MSSGTQAAKRSWIVLLYFYVAALVGLGFVITGITMTLFGAKSALFPTLGLSSSYYGYEFRYEPGTGRAAEPTEQERQASRDRAIDDRRSSGLDQLISGLIITGVGTPVLIWHFTRGRALSAKADGEPPRT
ncbi:MAG: hypothetical protein ACRDSR_20425 [Pseudonocardiaceae bacterium]